MVPGDSEGGTYKCSYAHIIRWGSHSAKKNALSTALLDLHVELYIELQESAS